MISIECQRADRRRARVIFRGPPVDAVAAEDIAEARFWDDDDPEREPLLRRLLVQPNVSAIAYPTSGHRDVLQVFLREPEGGLVFACVMMSGARLRDLLTQSPFIVEGFSLQILQGEHLSMEGIRTALLVWVERCFPDVVQPSITIERWTGPEGILQELLEWLYAQPSLQLEVSNAIFRGDDASSELHPDPGLADPPLEAAA
ncbi:MAG TPA: hypothetical protein VFK02_11280 [Kofleriaceae bacterium]|nr:hypothetical protein [Kofleriaceae bacterium]